MILVIVPSLARPPRFGVATRIRVVTALLTPAPSRKPVSWSLIAIIGLLACPHLNGQETTEFGHTSLSEHLLLAHRRAASDRRFDVAAGLQPLWLFHGGATFLDRITEDAQSLMENVADPEERLDANDFGFGWASGIDAALIRRAWDNDGIGVRFLQTSQWTATTAFPLVAASLRIQSNPPIFAPSVTSISGRFRSELVGLEANYYHWIANNATGIVGLRYLGLDDDLSVTIDSNPLDFHYRTRTRNDLFGVQLGLLAGPRLVWGGTIVSASAKIGVFGNDAEQQSVLDTGAVVLPIRESADNLSWIGEADVRAEWPVTRHLSLSTGYLLVWIDQIAVASDQLVASDFFGGRGHSERGTAIFHGAVAAMELSY